MRVRCHTRPEHRAAVHRVFYRCAPTTIPFDVANRFGAVLGSCGYRWDRCCVWRRPGSGIPIWRPSAVSGLPPRPIHSSSPRRHGCVGIYGGVIGYKLSRQGVIFLPAGLADVIPVNQHDRFMAVWFAHGASYLVGLAGGALLCFQVWQERGRPRVISFLPRTRVTAIARSSLPPSPSLSYSFGSTHLERPDQAL